MSEVWAEDLKSDKSVFNPRSPVHSRRKRNHKDNQFTLNQNIFFGDFAEEGGGSGGGGGGGECSGCSPEFKRLSKSGSSSKSSSMCYEMVERKGTYDEAVGYCRGQGG